VWLFIQSIPHDSSDAIYLVAGLLQLYKEVLKLTPGETTLTWKNLTRFIFQLYSDKEVKALEPSLYSSAKDGPKIYGFSTCTPGRLRLSTRYVDKHRHGRFIRKVVNAPDVQLLFVLDDYATTLKVYNHNSSLLKTISVSKTRKHTIITDFAWSQNEKRLGVTMHDNSLQFFDFGDNFSFNHILHNKGEMPNQLMIWYVTVWITCEASGTLNEWDILSEKSSPWPDAHSDQVTQMLELGGDLVASAGLDKVIVLWSMTWREVLMKLGLDKASAHSLAYSSDFDMLLAVGYELSANVYVFDSARDCSRRGQLVGHSHSINALEIMHQSPLALTTDDRSYLKVWDLRTLSCVQSVFLDGMVVNKIIDIKPLSSLLIIANRIHWYEYESSTTVDSNGIETVNVNLVTAVYSRRLEEFIVATTSDLRTVDSETGIITKIYAELSGADSEVSFIALIDKERRLLIALDSGEFAVAVTDNGKILKKFKGHECQITGMLYDPDSSRLVSVSIDGCVRIWRPTNLVEPIKELSEAHEANTVFLTVSFDQVLLCTADDNGHIFVWNLDTFKLIGEINCHSALIGIKLFETRPVLVVCDARGVVSLWNVASDASMVRTFFAFDGGTDNIFNESVKALCLLENFTEFFLTQENQTLLYLCTDRGGLRSYNLGHKITRVSKHIKKINKEAFERFVRVNGSEVRSKMYSVHTSPISASLEINEKVNRVRAHKARVISIEAVKLAGNAMLATLGADLHFKLWTAHLELKCDINITTTKPKLWSLEPNSYCRRAQLYINAQDMLTTIKRRFPKNLRVAEVLDPLKGAKYRRFSKETYITKSQIERVMSLREIAAFKQTSQQMGMMTSSLPEVSQSFSIASTKHSTPVPYSRSVSKLKKKLDTIDETVRVNSFDELQDSFLARRRQQGSVKKFKRLDTKKL